MTHEILNTWASLQKEIMNLTEEELVVILKEEKNCKNRPSVLYRIQGRINKLRSRREREELFR